MRRKKKTDSRRWHDRVRPLVLFLDIFFHDRVVIHRPDLLDLLQENHVAMLVISNAVETCGRMDAEENAEREQRHHGDADPKSASAEREPNQQAPATSGLRERINRGRIRNHVSGGDVHSVSAAIFVLAGRDS